MQLDVAIDFDGTVTLEDTTDVLLARFADPAWRLAEDEWLQGRIGSRECLARQVALLRATTRDIAAALAEVPVDDDFVPFVKAAEQLCANVTIVSDGFDRCIKTTLLRCGLALPTISNRLLRVGTQRWRAEFPFASSTCRSLSGVCKCAIARHDRALILVGDGRSDFCLAGEADFVLAKGPLVEHCRREGYPHAAISGFADARRWLSALGKSGLKDRALPGDPSEVTNA